jgi:hypothetical protein
MCVKWQSSIRTFSQIWWQSKYEILKNLFSCVWGFLPIFFLKKQGICNKFCFSAKGENYITSMGISIPVFNLLQVHLWMEGVYEQVDLTDYVQDTQPPMNIMERNLLLANYFIPRPTCCFRSYQEMWENNRVAGRLWDIINSTQQICIKPKGPTLPWCVVL